MINMVKLPTNKSSLFLRVAKGHFATSHSHINYYIDVTTQKARLSEAKAVAKEISKADAHVEAGWRDNYLIFESTPLIDVIAQIERWYGVEIRLHHKQIAQDLLSGSFRNESIQNVIRSLSIQYGFKYEIHKDIITIY